MSLSKYEVTLLFHEDSSRSRRACPFPLFPFSLSSFIFLYLQPIMSIIQPNRNPTFKRTLTLRDSTIPINIIQNTWHHRPDYFSWETLAPEPDESDSLSICDSAKIPTRDIATSKRWSPGRGRETDATSYIHDLSAYPRLYCSLSGGDLDVLGNALGFSKGSLPNGGSGDGLIDVTTCPHSASFDASPKSESRPARFVYIDPRASFAW